MEDGVRDFLLFVDIIPLRGVFQIHDEVDVRGPELFARLLLGLSCVQFHKLLPCNDIWLVYLNKVCDFFFLKNADFYLENFYFFPQNF